MSGKTVSRQTDASLPLLSPETIPDEMRRVLGGGNSPKSAGEFASLFRRLLNLVAEATEFNANEHKLRGGDRYEFIYDFDIHGAFHDALHVAESKLHDISFYEAVRTSNEISESPTTDRETAFLAGFIVHPFCKGNEFDVAAAALLFPETWEALSNMPGKSPRRDTMEKAALVIFDHLSKALALASGGSDAEKESFLVSAGRFLDMSGLGWEGVFETPSVEAAREGFCSGLAALAACASAEAENEMGAVL